ncbi:MAG: ABC transporter ATP-binding protein [Candidatus Rokubacteria bacterium]|nr:ABC transporter ATP-binding protein [Candidatus Rokubacteria bacterium]
MSAAGAIRVQALGKRYRLGHRERYRTLRDSIGRLFQGGPRDGAAATDTLWALQDVTFEVEPGEIVGLIGANGAGKSTLLKILSRVTKPTRGRAEVHGRVGSLLEVGTGFHPELTGRENIYLNGAILGMHRHEIQRKFDEIVAFAEVAKFLDTPVKHYSSGMYLRLGFSVAAHLEPEILLVDEVLAVGDAQFQRKCLGKMSEVARGGRTVLLVSHNMAAIQNLCTNALLLVRGELAFYGPTREAVHRYLSVAEDASTGLVSLVDHPGREPSKGALLTEIGLRGTARGTYRTVVTTGEDVDFEIGYDTQNQSLDYAVLVVFASTGDRVCTVATHLSPTFAGTLLWKGMLECHSPRFPLAEGEYSLLVAIGTRTPVMNVDEVHDAFRFRVEAGDYFGTGRTLQRGQGHLAQRSFWRIVE